MFRSWLLTLLTLTACSLSAQSNLDRYVREAIENNLSIREKKLLEEKQAYSLKQAGRQYGPQVGFLTSYSLAAGGRSIDFPIGSLLNDVYSTLNSLTGTQDFSQVENATVYFLPDNYYDARLRIAQPILQPEIKFNQRIKQEETVLAGLMTDQAKRDLVRDVKTAYLQWMQAREGISIIRDGLNLLEENKRMTESLVKNGMALPSAVMRLDAEIDAVQAELKRAETDRLNAARYFNFLLHRPADSEIVPDSFPDVPRLTSGMNVDSREELLQLRSGIRIQDLALTLEEKHFAPRLGLQVDVGSQAYAPDWGGYVLAGVQLEIPIWDNKISRLKRQEWKSDIASNEARYAWTREALTVQLETEIQNLETALAIFASYSSSLSTNQRLYAETARRYKEGLSNYIELLDARTQVTNTRLQQNIARYQAWIRHVNIERISASSPIE